MVIGSSTRAAGGYTNPKPGTFAERVGHAHPVVASPPGGDHRGRGWVLASGWHLRDGAGRRPRGCGGCGRAGARVVQRVHRGRLADAGNPSGQHPPDHGRGPAGGVDPVRIGLLALPRSSPSAAPRPRSSSSKVTPLPGSMARPRPHPRASRSWRTVDQGVRSLAGSH